MNDINENIIPSCSGTACSNGTALSKWLSVRMFFLFDLGEMMNLFNL